MWVSSVCSRSSSALVSGLVTTSLGCCKGSGAQVLILCDSGLSWCPPTCGETDLTFRRTGSSSCGTAASGWLEISNSVDCTFHLWCQQMQGSSSSTPREFLHSTSKALAALRVSWRLHSSRKSLLLLQMLGAAGRVGPSQLLLHGFPGRIFFVHSFS